MSELGNYLQLQNEEWQETVQRASIHNSWFLPEFSNSAAQNIATHFLQKDTLSAWAQSYAIPENNNHPKNIGVVMAGNIPLVGFHDFLCVFLCGFSMRIMFSHS